MAKISKKPIVVITVLLVSFYAYKAFEFNSKVRNFNTKIHVGDSIAYVIGLLGRPSLYDDDHVAEEDKEHNQASDKGGRTILVVYRGLIYLRSDLNLLFDHDSGKLKEKNRAQYLGSIEAAWMPLPAPDNTCSLAEGLASTPSPRVLTFCPLER